MKSNIFGEEEQQEVVLYSVPIIWVAGKGKASFFWKNAVGEIRKKVYLGLPMKHLTRETGRWYLGQILQSTKFCSDGEHHLEQQLFGKDTAYSKSLQVPYKSFLSTESLSLVYY